MDQGMVKSSIKQDDAVYTAITGNTQVSRISSLLPSVEGGSQSRSCGAEKCS